MIDALRIERKIDGFDGSSSLIPVNMHFREDYECTQKKTDINSKNFNATVKYLYICMAHSVLIVLCNSFHRRPDLFIISLIHLFISHCNTESRPLS